uniref:Reverse transcriptase domain-containing protein n=1 Tax=Arundo donax TaxID=35708 RepID=A0A0A8XR28_ARUDO
MSGEKEGVFQGHKGVWMIFVELWRTARSQTWVIRGDTFTWRNSNHRCENYIRERLDRAAANVEWQMRFPGYRVINGEHRHSDHHPVIVIIEEMEERPTRRNQQNFRFEAGWTQEEQCEVIVENAWKKSKELRRGTVEDCVKEVAIDLWDWSRNILGDLEKRIKKAKKNLEECRRHPINQGNINREAMLKFKLDRLEDQRDLYWKQRAHVNWLEKGDRNTKFYHQYASDRRRRNKIKKLVKDDGGVVTEVAVMCGVVTNFYKSLFESHAGYDDLLQYVQSCVTNDMNHILMEEIIEKEIKQALDSIGDLKAPGKDGMPVLFYKRYWNIVGPDVVREVQHFIAAGDMPDSWNETVVALIPKVPNLDKLKDLRPISLCNVVYKIASKVLANWLKQILSDIIAPSQSAFVPGHLITDNVLLAYELSHHLQNKRRGADRYAAIKLDMSKAYDRVEWPFFGGNDGEDGL